MGIFQIISKQYLSTLVLDRGTSYYLNMNYTQKKEAGLYAGLGVLYRAQAELEYGDSVGYRVVTKAIRHLMGQIAVWEK